MSSWSACARPASRPTARARCGPPRPPCCRPRCAATRRDLPQLAGHDKAALDAYRADTRAHDQEEELRLGYVAFTRAAHRLSVTSYLWSPRTTPYGPSTYQEVVRDQLEAWGEPVEEGHWLDKPAKGDPNPYDAVDPSRPVARARPGPRGGAAARGRPRRRATPTRRRPTTTSTWSRPRRSPTGTSSSTGWSPRRGPTATTSSTCRCRRRCRRPRCRGCALTPRRSPASWPDRCRGSRRRPPGSAPASTPGSRRGSASRTSSTPTSCRARPTPASTPTTTSPS